MPSTVVVSAIEHWPIDRLVLDGRNARSHPARQIDRLATNIRRFGFVIPILVGKDNVIIGGHARLAAARKLKMSEVPVIIIDHLSDMERRALALADNRLAEDSVWDEERLRLELSALRDVSFDLELTGFDQDELERLLADADTEGLKDGDSIPDMPAVPTSATGDLWCAGEHRILCGDALSGDDVDRLMAGARGDLGFVDPPPPIDQRLGGDGAGIPEDRLRRAEFRQVLFSGLEQFRRVLKPRASLYVCYAWKWQAAFEEALERAGFSIHCQIIWLKTGPARGTARYRPQHEALFYCYRTGQRDLWFGGKAQSSLWQADGPESKDKQPGTRAAEQAERAISNSSKPGDVVVDLCGGAGSTLIACERRGRKARLLEIERGYVDVTLRRWRQESGVEATLDGDGRTFREIAAQRRQQTA